MNSVFMLCCFVGLCLISFTHFNAADSIILKDHDFEIEAKRVENSQQASPTQQQHPKQFIQSCDEARASGVYELRLSSKSVPFTAFCDVDTLYGKWLVIQQRVDGSVDFNRSWAEYRDGFGTIGESGEFWLGLEKIYQITSTGTFELVIEIKNEAGEYGFARYQEYGIAAESAKYRLQIGSYSGTIPNNLVNNKGEFQLYGETGGCFGYYPGGWWMKYCGFSFLNGPYTANAEHGKGIYWNKWTNAATFSRMMIRRKRQWM